MALDKQQWQHELRMFFSLYLGTCEFTDVEKG